MAILVKRRKDMSYDEFADYWLNHHAKVFMSTRIVHKCLLRYEQVRSSGVKPPSHPLIRVADAHLLVNRKGVERAEGHTHHRLRRDRDVRGGIISGYSGGAPSFCYLETVLMIISYRCGTPKNIRPSSTPMNSSLSTTRALRSCRSICGWASTTPGSSPRPSYSLPSSTLLVSISRLPISCARDVLDSRSALDALQPTIYLLSISTILQVSSSLRNTIWLI